MKISNLVTAFVLSLSLVLGACSSDTPEKTVYIKVSDIKKETINVDGMTCLGCEVTLEKSISKIKGIASVKASSSQNNVLIEYDKTKTDRKAIIKAIQGSGYKAKD
ncbi:heavy-metal-associated domain-containing protein [Sulfurimonas sp. MAG313]|nr:cation transporter [Sulfurimonas sp. MAG313]MDF1880064.1 heavy-metal-associated domain-containing protein [Sulfurimonas sp. MAG313]